MQAAIKLSGEDLGGIVAAALGQCGYLVTELILYGPDGKELNVERIDVQVELDPIAIRQTPDADREAERFRALLYPDIIQNAKPTRTTDKPAGG